MLRLRRRLLGQAPSARGLAAGRATCAQGPMVVVLFRSRVSAAAGREYAARSAEMFARARTMPGYVDAKTFLARDGEQLTVIHWESAETLRAWAEDEEHRRAQAEGHALVRRVRGRGGRGRAPLRVRAGLSRGLEHERQARHAAEDDARVQRQRRQVGTVEAPRAREQHAQRHLGLEGRQRRPEAVVRAEAEGEVVLPLAADVEHLGALEDGLVAV